MCRNFKIRGVLDLEMLRVIGLLRAARLNQGKVGKRSAFRNPITKSSEEKQCSEFGRSESNYERFHRSSQDDSDEEYFHKSPALDLSSIAIYC